jgi:glycine cleavage system H protein
MTPSDRVYTDTHEWVKVEDNIAIIGISDYAQAALGDITFVELPETDSSIEHGHECGVIESVKAASDLNAPIDGDIVEVNEALDGAPELLNEDPYGEGWIFKLANFDKAQLENLMDAAEYESTHDDDA